MKISACNSVCHVFSILLIAVIITVISAAGCARPNPGLREPKDYHQTREIPTTSTYDVSIEELENNPAYLSDLTPELRAAELARLWYEHGKRLERSSYTGAFAAFSRSAHISLESLLGEACRTPFHPTCLDLDRAYKQALNAITTMLSLHDWSPPDLARSRYRLAPGVARSLEALRSWNFQLERPTLRQPHMRPGLGLATVGCRQLDRHGTVCSPLTFVLTFSGALEAEQIELSLEALDAYQQEMLTLGGTHIPLAAAFEQTAQTLSTLASKNTPASLFCLSLPSIHTATMLMIVEPKDVLEITSTIISPLLRVPEIVNSTSFCMHTLSSPSPSNATLEAESPRRIMESLRAALRLTRGQPLTSETRHRLSLIAIGDRPAQVAVALAQRASRARPASSKRATRDLRLIPQTLLLVHTGEAPPTIVERTDVPVTTYLTPCDHECIVSIKKKLSSSATPIEPQAGSNKEGSSDYGDIPLSPVM
jgi:hypothetical protein